MPRPKPDTERKPVVIRFDPALLQRVDAHKGRTRAEKVFDLLERGLRSVGPSLPTPECQAEIVAHIEAKRVGRLTMADVRGPYKPNQKPSKK